MNTFYIKVMLSEDTVLSATFVPTTVKVICNALPEYDKYIDEVTSSDTNPNYHSKQTWTCS